MNIKSLERKEKTKLEYKKKLAKSEDPRKCKMQNTNKGTYF